MKKLFQYLILMLTAAIFLTACSESDERRHPLYIKALQDRNEGNGKDAAEKLCELLKRRPRSIYVHKLLATVYDEMLNDPAAAVYHYKAYLQAMPEAADAEEVQAWLTQAEKRCYIELNQRFGKETALPETAGEEKTTALEKAPENPETSADAAPGVQTAGSVPEKPVEKPQSENELIAAKDAEIAELKVKLSQYQVRYNLMRQEVERVRKNRKTPANPTGGKAVELPQTAEGATQYKVVAGDTPGSIARKVYGKSSLHHIIMRANPQLDARKMRPGMVLNIPAIEKKTTQGNAR